MIANFPSNIKLIPVSDVFLRLENAPIEKNSARRGRYVPAFLLLY
jgi:hypothetical protein